MKVYYINLDRSPERRAWFKQQAEALELDLVRVPAVDGRELPAAELDYWKGLSSGEDGINLSPGEVGCFLSHRRAWEAVLAGDEKWAFIAEDDVHFSIHATSFLLDDGWIPSEAEVVKAETDLKRHEFSPNFWPAPAGHKLRRLKSTHLNAGGYFLTRKAAGQLLAYSARRCEAVDGLIFADKYMEQHGLEILQIIPAICIQNGYIDPRANTSALISLLDDERGAAKKKRKITVVAKVKRELIRIFTQMRGLGLRTCRTLAGESKFISVGFNREGAALAVVDDQKLSG